MAVSFMLMVDAAVAYEGRAASTLERGQYLILHKPDKSLAVHGSRFKVLNYQRPGSEVTIYNSKMDEFADIWPAHFSVKPTSIIWSSNKGESLVIGVYKILQSLDISDLSTSKIKLSRSEKQLADQIEANILSYFPDMVVASIDREALTPYGSVDILVTTDSGSLLIIEVKRKIAAVAACSQVQRYGNHYRSLGKSVVECLMAPRASRNAIAYMAEHKQMFVTAVF